MTTVTFNSLRSGNTEGYTFSPGRMEESWGLNTWDPFTGGLREELGEVTATVAEFSEWV